MSRKQFFRLIFITLKQKKRVARMNTYQILTLLFFGGNFLIALLNEVGQFQRFYIAFNRCNRSVFKFFCRCSCVENF